MKYYKGIKAFFSTIVLLAVCVVIGYFVYTKVIKKPEVKEEKGFLTTTQTTITNETIREGLADIGELATEEYYYTEVETYDSSKKLWNWKLPFTTSKFVYSYDGTIKAGIDFSAVEVEKDDLKQLIVVTLPKSQILSNAIDEQSFQVYDEKSSIFNQVKIEDFNDTLVDLMTTAEEKAIAKGVLDKADKNACEIIKNFLLSVYDVRDFTIKVVTTE